MKRYIIAILYTGLFLVENLVMPFLGEIYMDKLGVKTFPINVFFIMFILVLAQIVLCGVLWSSAIQDKSIKEMIN